MVCGPAKQGKSSSRSTKIPIYDAAFAVTPAVSFQRPQLERLL
jgi:hypothetical protein